MVQCQQENARQAWKVFRTYKEFKKGPGGSVLLISLKCGSVGLNIVEANQVILLDPWWNESIEQQAIDRVFRIGQKKDVRVFKFVMQDSIEDRVMDIQQAKTNLILNALAGIKGLCQLTEGASSTVSRNARREDVQKLFGIQS